MTTQTAQLATSTWSLHRSIEAGANLLDIPGQARDHGLGALEVCHFHFPSTDDGYLADLRGAFADAGIAFLTLLIDAGDPTHPDPEERRRQLATMGSWVDIAARCGAARARVIAGDAAPSPESLALSAEGLRPLAARAEGQGVRLTTENWHPLLSTPDAILTLLDQLEGSVGLKLDFGNWGYPAPFDALARIAPRAEDTHAKAQYPVAGQMDREDFTQCLDLCRAAGFSGPHSLIFDGPMDAAHDEWASLDQMREVVLPYLIPPSSGVGGPAPPALEAGQRS